MMKPAGRDTSPSVVIAHEDPGTADALRHAVAADGGWRPVVAATGADGLAAALASDEHAVAVVGCRRLAELPAAASVPVLAIGDDSRAEDVRAALEAGARSLVSWPDCMADLAGELSRLASQPRGRPRPVPRSTVVVVAGVQGGVGTTTLCVHLAGAWGRWGPGPVLLADLAGGLGFRLDLGSGARGWAAVDAGADVTGDVLSGMAAPFWPNWSVLPLPGLADGRTTPAPEPHVVAAVLHAAAQRYRVVVVDLPPRPGPSGEVALAAADVILAVARPDSAGMHALETAYAAWSKPDAARPARPAGRDRRAARVGLVVSGTSARAPLSRREVEARLGARLWADVPAAAAELNAAAEDGLLLLHQPDHVAVNAMLTLAHRVLPLTAEASAR